MITGMSREVPNHAERISTIGGNRVPPAPGIGTAFTIEDGTTAFTIEDGITAFVLEDA